MATINLICHLVKVRVYMIRAAICAQALWPARASDGNNTDGRTHCLCCTITLRRAVIDLPEQHYGYTFDVGKHCGNNTLAFGFRGYDCCMVAASLPLPLPVPVPAHPLIQVHITIKYLLKHTETASCPGCL